MDNNNSSSSESGYLLNFSFSKRRLGSKEEILLSDDGPVSNAGMSSGVISETSLESDHILLKKKSLLKRKSKGSLKVFYGEIIDLKLIKFNLSSLYSSIMVVYSKNGYSKHLIRLSSSDGFAVRWFYDELVLRYSLMKSNLNRSDIFKSNEEDFLKNDDLGESTKLDDFMSNMDVEISDKRKRKISRQMKFDRCSSGEY